MGADEQAFGYGAGYADATRKAQAKIDALVEALRGLLHKIDIPQQAMGLAADIHRARAALKAATEQP